MPANFRDTFNDMWSRSEVLESQRRDLESLWDIAFEAGREEGDEEGFERGREEGLEEARDE